MPDIKANVRFYLTEEGGRSMGFPRGCGERCGIPFSFQGELFDCWILLSYMNMNIELGEWVTVPVKFLSPDLIKPRLKVGDKFKLWEGKFIADGEVLNIIMCDGN